MPESADANKKLQTMHRVFNGAVEIFKSTDRKWKLKLSFDQDGVTLDDEGEFRLRYEVTDDGRIIASGGSANMSIYDPDAERHIANAIGNAIKNKFG
jgi:hypothetical protein